MARSRSLWFVKSPSSMSIIKIIELSGERISFAMFSLLYRIFYSFSLFFAFFCFKEKFLTSLVTSLRRTKVVSSMKYSISCTLMFT